MAYVCGFTLYKHSVMLKSRRGTMLDAQRQLRTRGPGTGQEGDRPRCLRESRDRRGQSGAPLPLREVRISLSARDPAHQVRRDTAAPQTSRDERYPLRPGQLQVPVLWQASRRLGSPRSPDPRPREAPLARRHEQLGQRGDGLHQVQREERQPPPDGVRYVPQEHAQGAALRGDGLVLARPQRRAAPLRRAVLRRRKPGGFLAVSISDQLFVEWRYSLPQN